MGALVFCFCAPGFARRISLLFRDYYTGTDRKGMLKICGHIRRNVRCPQNNVFFAAAACENCCLDPLCKPRLASG